jgi:hypothetical protein
MGVSIENIVKGLVSEYLETTKVFDKVLQEYKGLHAGLLDQKSKNPNLSFVDVKDEILNLFKFQQKSALIMKDAEAYLNRLYVLKSIADLTEMNLDLSEEDANLLNLISKSVNIFYTSKNGNLVELNPELVATFTKTTLEKYSSDDKLQEILNNI